MTDKPEPGVGSEAATLRSASVYQLFEPCVPLREALSTGFWLSMDVFCVRVRVLPALSRAIRTVVWSPSPLTVMVLQEPSAMASRVHVKLARPEVASEAELLRVIGPRYQPFSPAVPLRLALIVGSWESTFAVKVPISELSRNE